MSLGPGVLITVLLICRIADLSGCPGPCIDVPGYSSDGREACVFLSDEFLPWDGSYSVCSNYGAELVVAPDSKTNDVIYSALRRLNPVVEPWIGGHVFAKQWNWITGSPFYKTTFCCSSLEALHTNGTPQNTPSLCVPSCLSQHYQYAYVWGDVCMCSNSTCGGGDTVTCNDACDGDVSTPCAEDQVNLTIYEANYVDSVHWNELSQTYKECGVLHVNNNGTSIGADQCGQPLRFLCHNGSTGKVTRSDGPLSFFNAAMDCLDQGEELLAHPANQHILRQLHKGSYWLGLTRFSVEWHTGVRPRFYSLPDFNNDRIGGCFFVNPMSIRNKWYTGRCDEPRQALCVKSYPTVNVLDMDSVPNEDSVIFPAQQSCTWWEARIICANDDSRLVIIPDNVTNAIVSKAVSGWEPLWIGGRINRHPWATVTGYPLFRYSGCCPLNTNQSAARLEINSMAACVSLCNRQNFRYAFRKDNECVCSNQTCSTEAEGVCLDKCPNPKWEYCGNRQDNLYSVHESTGLDLPEWTSDLINQKFTRACAAVRIGSSGVHMISGDCGYSECFMCTNYNGTGGANITVHHVKKYWLEARDYCRQNGQDLAVVRRNNSVLESLSYGTYWIGISQFGMNWYTGAEITYNDLNTFEDASIGGALSVKKPPGRIWSVAPCSRKLQPLCFKEKPATTTSTRETSPSVTTINSSVSRPTQDHTSNTSPDVNTISAPSYPSSSSPSSSSPSSSSTPSSRPSGLEIVIAVCITLIVVILVVFGTLLTMYLRQRRTNHTLGVDGRPLTAPVVHRNALYSSENTL